MEEKSTHLMLSLKNSHIRKLGQLKIKSDRLHVSCTMLKCSGVGEKSCSDPFLSLCLADVLLQTPVGVFVGYKAEPETCPASNNFHSTEAGKDHMQITPQA